MTEDHVVEDEATREIDQILPRSWIVILLHELPIPGWWESMEDGLDLTGGRGGLTWQAN